MKHWGDIFPVELTKGQVAFIDLEDYDKIKGRKWTYTSHGYAHNGNLGYLHRLIMDAPKGMKVDHINGNTLDNRKCNLRVCTQQQNLWNSVAKVNGKVKYKGVSHDPNRGSDKKYKAEIWKDGKRNNLGWYKTPEEAALVYNEKAKELHGEFAKLNEVAV